MKFIFIHLIRFRVDNARVFQPVCVNLSTTVGQVACRVADYCVQDSHSVICNTLRLQMKKNISLPKNGNFNLQKRTDETT